MAEAIDWDASGGGRSVLLKETGPKDKRMLRAAAAWEAFVKELSEETGIPHISYSYFDTKNYFEIRLRGRPETVRYGLGGERQVIAKAIMPGFAKNFEFKGEGKTGYFNKADTEKWLVQIMKWARSLDGKREMGIDGTQAQAKAV